MQTIPLLALWEGLIAWLDEHWANLPQPWWIIFALFNAILLVAFLGELILLRRIRKTASGHDDAKRSDRISQLVWVVLYLLILALSLRAGRWDETVPRTWTTVWIGAGVALAGMSIRLYAMWVLGSNFRYVAKMTESHKLVTTGPYKLVRHPLYLGAILLFTGIGLIQCCLYIVAILMLVVLPGSVIRIRKEERMLREQFGGEYDAWAGRTKRIIPYVL